MDGSPTFSPKSPSRSASRSPSRLTSGAGSPAGIRPRCPSDPRTERQKLLGIPHYCSQENHEAPGSAQRQAPYSYQPMASASATDLFAATPPYSVAIPDTAQAPAPAGTRAPGGRSGVAWLFDLELNRHGIPKAFENSPRFSYDNSPYFQPAKHRLAPWSNAGRQQRAQDDETRSAGNGKGDQMDVDTPQPRRPGSSTQRQPQLHELMQRAIDARTATTEQEQIAQGPNQGADGAMDIAMVEAGGREGGFRDAFPFRGSNGKAS